MTADAPSFGEVRLHLRAARELHLIGPSAGASVNHAGFPSWLSLRADRTAAVVVGGGVVAAHWRVDHDADAVTLAGDALILTVRAPVDALSDVKEERAFVLTFTDPADAREARDALRATEPSRGKRGGIEPESNESDDDDDRADADRADADRAVVAVAAAPRRAPSNAFDAKIAEDSAAEYFRYYASIPQQQNMLQDRVRTGTYFTAMMENAADFRDKVVVDVGAGSGILSFFAAMAGARRVYALEASDMAKHCRALAEGNPRLRDVVVVVQGKVEEAELPEPADVLVSEPMGTLLFNERMIESYLIARDRFLRRPSGRDAPRMGTDDPEAEAEAEAKKKTKKKNSNSSANANATPSGSGAARRPSGHAGRMFPGAGRVHCAPFVDAALHAEISDKATFWRAEDFYGVDLTPLAAAAERSYFRQCVVDAFDPSALVAAPASFEWDFATVAPSELETMEFPLEFVVRGEKAGAGTRDAAGAGEGGGTGVGAGGTRSAGGTRGDGTGAEGTKGKRGRNGAPEGGAGDDDGSVEIHGMAAWFDVLFAGTRATRWLTTAPGLPTTHWFQMRLAFERPLRARVGAKASGTMRMVAGSNQSYVVGVELECEGNRAVGEWDLKDPYYRQQVHPQPGYTAEQNARWYGVSPEEWTRGEREDAANERRYP